MKRIWESKLLPWIFLLLGIVFSVLLTWKSSLWIKETEQIRFQSASSHIVNLIQKELDAHIQLIHSVAAFMNASDDVTREEWRQFALENHINENFLGFRALGYAPLIHASERSHHEQKVRDEGFPHYTIFQINPSSNSDMFPITYIEPLSELNEKAFGFDFASESVRKDALYKAFLRNDATLSSKIMLVQKYGTDYQAGFLIFFPLYQTKNATSLQEEHMKQAKGVVYIAIDAKKLFEQLLQSNYILVDFEIYDGEYPLEQNLLYNSKPDLVEPRLSEYVSLEIFGKTWTIHIKAQSALEMSNSHYAPWFQMLFGLILFSLISSLIYVLQRTQKKAYAIAAEKTKMLAQSEAEIRSIFQTMQEGIMIMNDQGVIIECNLAAQEMFQLSKSEIVGNTSSNSKWRAIHEDGTVFDIEERPSFRAFATGEAQNNVIMGIKRDDDSYLWIKVNAQPLYSDDFDKINSVLVSFSDITAYRNSKYKLEKYLQIIDAHVIISSTDLHGIITEASEAFCKISGYSKEELIGKSHNIVRHPDMPKTLYKEMWNNLKQGIVWSGEIKNRRKDGTDYWIETIIEPRYNEEYEMVGYTAIRHDITDKKRVEELSITDRLTGLYNRLKLDELFASYLSIAKRYQTPFSVILLDIDKFKSVNDTYGHQVGDNLLQELAKLLKTNVRFEDAVGRWGGEEFLILLPNSDLESARSLAEKLRSLMEAQNFAYVGKRTSSFGVATYHVHDDEKSMIVRADAALYLAKENGRNRVEIETYMCTLPAL